MLRQIIDTWVISLILKKIFGREQSLWLGMSQPLPTGRFEWVDPSQFMSDNISANCEEGYLLEVDVKYLKELHNLHNDLPFMCEKMVVDGV